MKRFTALAALAALQLAAVLPAMAEAPQQAPGADQRQEGHRHHGPSAEERKQWENMTPEQRQQAMEQRRAEREKNMTPEQKAEREARRAKWEAMTPEERQAAREAHRREHPQGERPHGQRPQQ